jgi:Ca-activated chloride channel family protein
VQVPTTAIGTTGKAGRRPALHAAIDTITSEGSTDMESGLRMGFDVARETAARFGGRTRVMLFTDERPNVGDTSAKGFMGMARAASRDGIGLTTVGVGTQFGAELATAISSVRGGNLFFFPDAATMTAKFHKDLDTMVTELAHDLKLVVRGTNGHALVGLYGIPGEAVRRLPDGGLEMDVETIFLSRDKGGIFFAFAPAGAGALPPVPGPVGEASVSYRDLRGHGFTDRLSFEMWPAGAPLPLGLARGRLLVDEVTTLKAAAAAHLEKNDQETAFRLVRAAKTRFVQSGVPGLEKEIELLTRLDETLTKLSGHAGEPLVLRPRNPLTGLPD